MRIIVTAGGTGGHIYPALAIIEKFQAKEHDLEILYIGTHNRMEKDIIPAKKIKYIPIEIYGFSKTKWIQNIKNIFHIKNAQKKCEQIMKEFKPDIVLGFGGYVTYPVIKTAKKLKIKTFLHEQNSFAGKANIALSKDVDLVGVTFEKSIKDFKKAKKVVVTGHPNGERALTIPAASKTEFFSNSLPLVTIAGGSLGSGSMNKALKEYLLSVQDKKYNVLYITGKWHYDEFIKDTRFPPNVKVISYYDPLTSILKITDCFVTRAGAGTLSEVVALKIPSIVIPSPNVANNHQYYNALEIKNKNACEMIIESYLTPSLISAKIEELLFDENKKLIMKEQMSKIKSANSNEIIYNLIKEVRK